jgi:hemerythrin-like domain-containing protein
MRPSIQPVAPSVDDPIELLLACHNKVRRFADLSVRLRDHVATHGADKQAQEAAQSILRYFNIAAPLHHDDEEQDLFPALRTMGIDGLNLALSSLTTEHTRLNALWQRMQPWLQDMAQGMSTEVPSTVEEFAQAYKAHAQREEDEVYPAASQLTAAQRLRISAAMVRRRTAG